MEWPISYKDLKNKLETLEEEVNKKPTGYVIKGETVFDESFDMEDGGGVSDKELVLKTGSSYDVYITMPSGDGTTIQTVCVKSLEPQIYIEDDVEMGLLISGELSYIAAPFVIISPYSQFSELLGARTAVLLEGFGTKTVSIKIVESDLVEKIPPEIVSTGIFPVFDFTSNPFEINKLNTLTTDLVAIDQLRDAVQEGPIVIKYAIDDNGFYKNVCVFVTAMYRADVDQYQAAGVTCTTQGDNAHLYNLTISSMGAMITISEHYFIPEYPTTNGSYILKYISGAGIQWVKED